MDKNLDFGSFFRGHISRKAEIDLNGPCSTRGKTLLVKPLLEYRFMVLVENKHHRYDYHE